MGGALTQDFKILYGKFSPAEKSDIDDFAREYRLDILAKWNVFVNNGKKPKNERVNIIRRHAKKGAKKSG